jgi:prolipoprotein diacylglyceryl transferase
MTPSLATIPAPPTDPSGTLPWSIELGPLSIRPYGILIAAGVLIAMTLTRSRFVAKGGSAEFADSVAFRAVVMGFVGARLAYVLPRLGYFADNPLQVLQVWEGGLALFGGLTLGTLTVVWLFRRRWRDLGLFLDAAAPAVPIAQALGRWGNYFNQELYGTPTTLPWALEVDPPFRVQRYAEFATFHPTFLYESLWNLGLAAFLLWLDRRRVLPRGALALLYFIGYATARFGLELLRTDTTFRLLGLSRNAWVSLLVVVASSALLAVWLRRAPSREDDDPHPEEPATPPASSQVE